MKLPALLASLPLAAALLIGQPTSASPSAGVATAIAPATPVPAIIDRILNAVGLKARFVVVASERVPNAAAVIVEGQRCILYNPAFMQAINHATQTNWAGVSILAHEIGHHLNGHTLSADPRNQASSYRDELEADEFSGFVLRRLGAPAEASVAALSLLAPDEDSPTHPPRAIRLAAVTRGWNDGGEDQAAIAATAPTPALPVQAAVPASVPAVSAAAPRGQLNPAAVAGRITFDAAPHRVLYLTRRLNLVADEPGGARILGSLEPTRSRRYPYRLRASAGGGSLYVTNAGAVVNAAGRRVGRLTLV